MIQRLIARISQSNAQRDKPETDVSLVATALLVEVINADHQQSEEELNALRDHCASALDLSPAAADELIANAVKISKSATSLWEHTDLINQNLDINAKYELIFSMWKIAYADNELDRYEEHLIRKVSELIYVPHTMFIKAKHDALKLMDR